MNPTYVIKTKDLPSSRYKFFAKELGMSTTRFKKLVKQRTCIVLKIYRNQVITEFGGDYNLKYNGRKIISHEDYEDCKYNLMVEEIDLDYGNLFDTETEKFKCYECT